MHTFSYPAMPIYSLDQSAYIRQMYEWHVKMAQHYEAKRDYHMERAKHLQKLMDDKVVPLQWPNDGVA